MEDYYEKLSEGNETVSGTFLILLNSILGIVFNTCI